MKMMGTDKVRACRCLKVGVCLCVFVCVCVYLCVCLKYLDKERQRARGGHTESQSNHPPTPTSTSADSIRTGRKGGGGVAVTSIRRLEETQYLRSIRGEGGYTCSITTTIHQR